MVRPEAALEMIPAMIAYVGHEDRILYANERYAAKYDLSLDQVINRKLDEIAPALYPRIVPKLRAARAGEPQDFAIEYLDASGNSCWVQANYIPHRNSSDSVAGVLAVIREIRDLDQLDTINSIFRYAVDQGMEGFALHDNEGIFTYINPAQAAMYGYTPNEVIGNGWQMFYDRQEIEAINTTHFPELLRDGKWHGVLKGRKKDGSYFDVEVTLTLLINQEDQPSGLVCNCRDVTRRLKEEEFLRRLQRIEALGQLTGGVAHDFNNLLAVIIGNLELLQVGDLSPEFTEAIEQALNASHSGVALTNRLLAFARKQKLAPVPIVAGDLIEGMQNMLSRSLGEQIAVVVSVEDELWSCQADRSQLENALLNLALNARDAMPHGGTVGITARNRSDIRPADGAQPGSDFISIAVTDTGCGMNDDVLQKMFDPFFTTKGVGQGTGLGLSMVHGFVSQTGGFVEATSEPDKGSEVTIFLPRLTETPAQTHPVHESVPPGAGETILVIEDQPHVRTVVSKLLEDLGYATLQAGDGQEALSRLQAGERVDLILSDIVLPGKLKGRELLAAVQRERPGLKILFMSGYPGSELPDDVPLLTKPFTQEQLARQVHALMEQAKPDWSISDR